MPASGLQVVEALFLITMLMIKAYRGKARINEALSEVMLQLPFLPLTPLRSVLFFAFSSSSLKKLIALGVFRWSPVRISIPALSLVRVLCKSLTRVVRY